MQLDQLPSYVIVVAATNHGELLDRAVWRRFQMRLAMPAPRKAEITVFLDRIMSNWSEFPSISLTKIAGKLGNVSYAEALDFCQNVRRRQILGLGELSVDAALHAELELWTKRVTPEILNAERPEQTVTEAQARS
jgi:SpoVK/Ycf46/Vps4 family AAA+-type ATPase